LPGKKARLVEVPVDGDHTEVKVGQVAEQGTGHVNRPGAAAGALLHNLGCAGLSAVGDSDGLAAQALVHDGRRQSHDVLREAIVGGVTVAGVGRSGGSVVVGSTTRARRALRALAVGAAARARAAGWGGSTGGGRRRRRRSSGLRSRSRGNLRSGSGGRLRSSLSRAGRGLVTRRRWSSWSWRSWSGSRSGLG
jgi:hypothetical protein